MNNKPVPQEDSAAVNYALYKITGSQIVTAHGIKVAAHL
jgi:hypothetical protein